LPVGDAFCSGSGGPEAGAEAGVEERVPMGCVVVSIAKKSHAHANGRLRVGDHIVSVHGTCVRGHRFRDIIAAIRAPPPPPKPNVSWQVKIHIAGEANIDLGEFEDEEVAARAYDEAARPLGRHLNFPSPQPVAQAKQEGPGVLAPVPALLEEEGARAEKEEEREEEERQRLCEENIVLRGRLRAMEETGPTAVEAALDVDDDDDDDDGNGTTEESA